MLPSLLVACLLAFVAAWLLVGRAVPHLLGDFSHLFAVKIDLNVLIFSVVLVLGIGLVLSVVPWMLTRIRARVEKYSSQGPGTEAQPPGRRRIGGYNAYTLFPSASTVCEVALAFIMFVVGGLLAREIWIRHQIEPGYASETVLSMSVAMPRNLFHSNKEQKAFMLQVFQQVDELSGIERASLSTSLPADPLTQSVYFSKEGVVYSPRERIKSNFVGIDYLQMINVPLLAGRYFLMEDLQSSVLPVVINKTMAGMYWQDQDPVGETIYIGSSQRMAEIVGVVANLNPVEGGDLETPALYLLYWQVSCDDINLLIKTSNAPHDIAASVKDAIWSIDSEVPVEEEVWLSTVQWQHLKNQRGLLIGYAMLSLLGLLVARSSVVSSVQQFIEWRLLEIGLLKKRGYSAIKIQLRVLKALFFSIAPGIILDMAGSFFVIRLIFVHLDILETGLGVFAGVSSFLIIILLTSAIVSSREAGKINANHALRYG